MADLKWRKLKDYDRAEEIFLQILEIEPKKEQIYLEFARFLKYRKRFEDAKKYVRKLIYIDISNENAYVLLSNILIEEGKGLAAALSYGLLRLLYPENNMVDSFFSNYSLPAVKDTMPWDRENEELLIHENEKKLVALLAVSRVWCEKLYSPQISNEVLRNASKTGESHRSDICDMVFWCSRLMAMTDIPAYIYYGDKSRFSSCFLYIFRGIIYYFSSGFFKVS